jgi:chaperonin cofactor prefoldin|tara:strand:+ start:174 stop:365 length:192 start_codon:yes stop_codon:yes gene_type:complete
MDNDSIARLDIRIIKTMLADLTVDIESIKETIESLEQNNEDVDTKLTDISSSLEILLQNAEID